MATPCMRVVAATLSPALLGVAACALGLGGGCSSVRAVDVPQVACDALPSWREGAAKERIVDIVARATAAGSPEFVPVEDRIAVFDQDGTLWAEQPFYVQLAFAVDRVKALRDAHPE